jgi:hypothetical protein
MHPGTMLTDAIRQWPTPQATDDDRGDDREANREGSPSLTGAMSLWATPLKRDYRSGLGTQKRVGSPALNEQVALWATPNVPNGGRMRSDEAEQVATKGQAGGTKHQVTLDAQARALWPTPAATPYGSSQNGINGKGGANERPSATTPSLERMSRSFLPLRPTSTAGDACSPSAPTSRLRSWPTPDAQMFGSALGANQKGPATITDAARHWKTPHGFANTDQYGRTGGGGGEFHKQAMKGAPAKAKLNPQFVEWLMGWPIGWTASALAATEWSRWQQRMRSAFLQLARDSGLSVDDAVFDGSVS